MLWVWVAMTNLSMRWFTSQIQCRTVAQRWQSEPNPPPFSNQQRHRPVYHTSTFNATVNFCHWGLRSCMKSSLQVWEQHKLKLAVSTIAVLVAWTVKAFPIFNLAFQTLYRATQSSSNTVGWSELCFYTRPLIEGWDWALLSLQRFSQAFPTVIHGQAHTTGASAQLRLLQLFLNGNV